jgi:hypothetical protein
MDPLERLRAPCLCWPIEDVSDDGKTLGARGKGWLTRAEALHQALQNVECWQHRENSEECVVVHLEAEREE